MHAIINHLFLPGMILGFASPFAAIVFAAILYARHRRLIEPERRVPIVAYILAVIICGGIAGYAGLIGGMMLACPQAGNLCGLFGFFVTGPIAAFFAVVLVGLALFLVRPAPDR
jgi:hypothetical protein